MDPNRTLGSIPYGLIDVAEEEEEDDSDELTITRSMASPASESSSSPSFPPIAQPETPREPMEFLCRSWSISASEISTALSHKSNHKHSDLLPHQNPYSSPVSTATDTSPPLTEKLATVVHARRTGSIGKWFHHREFIGGSGTAVKKRDKARLENARLHSAVSIAALATAIASVAASGNTDDVVSASKTSSALSSATELLASHCVELAEVSGASHDSVISAVRSAVNVRGPGDLLTLTAAAATALRGEAALRARVPKEAKNNAAITPCERILPEVHECSSEMEIASITEEQIPVAKVDESNSVLTGQLMQRTKNGVLRWKNVSVYISKKSQVVVEIKSKHVGGAFSTKNKGIVNEVWDTLGNGKEREKSEEEEEEELYFGMRTVKGMMEFKCKREADKQRWVNGVRELLRCVHVAAAAEDMETPLMGDDDT